MIKKDDILRFENLSQFPSLIHGFSTEPFGSMRDIHDGYQKSIDYFCKALGTDAEKLVRMNQVHGGNVAWATERNFDETISDTDGMLTEEKNVFLGVITADCLPLFFYDPKKEIVAAVHAGWRGLFAEIISAAVTKMIAKGSNPSDILVGIGPSIRVCCYEVQQDFIDKFNEKFDAEKYIERREGKIFFSTQKLAEDQLVELKIRREHIEDGNYCTFDNKDVYSCRRDGGQFGEIMGIIGQR